MYVFPTENSEFFVLRAVNQSYVLYFARHWFRDKPPSPTPTLDLLHTRLIFRLKTIGTKKDYFLKGNCLGKVERPKG